MTKEGTIVVRTRGGAKERIRESEFDPKVHTKVAETTAKREAEKATKEKS
jgi:hypothetical protein